MKFKSWMEVYSQLKESLAEQIEKHKLYDKNISIMCKNLSAEEAIGNPEDRDYPIIRGREKMIEAEFMGASGQVFTDEYGDATYTVDELLKIPLDSNRNRADFIAGLNAIYRYLNLCDKTVHCRDLEPRQCGEELLKVIKPGIKVLLIGLQPRLLEFLAARQPVRVIDLDCENIGTKKFGVQIEPENKTEDGIEWCDLIFATGSTIVNGTITTFLDRKKPVLFFGVTISGPAQILNLETYCALGH